MPAKHCCWQTAWAAHLQVCICVQSRVLLPQVCCCIQLAGLQVQPELLDDWTLQMLQRQQIKIWQCVA
jgi:hypothetical protein